MPHLLDLFCGRGGWTKPALTNGWTATGVDLDDHGYPAELIRRRLPADISDLIRPDTALIVASPPCEQFARRHLPWIADQQPLDLRCLRWSVELARTSRTTTIIECSKFAAQYAQGGIRFGLWTLWGDIPALMPQLPPRKRWPHAHAWLSNSQRAALAAEIPPAMADWILHHAQIRKGNRQCSNDTQTGTIAAPCSTVAGAEHGAPSVEDSWTN